jgi:hypothetical protein
LIVIRIVSRTTVRTIYVSVLATCALLVGCRGKALATAVLTAPGTADVSFQSTGAPVVLWADTDGKWHGGAHSHFAAHYEVDIMSGANKLGHITCDTKDSTESVCGTHARTGDDNSGDCEVKLACAVPTIPAGLASIHVAGTLGVATSDVKKMSVNVRAE